MQTADRGDAAPLAELLARSVLDNLYRFVVRAVAGPDGLVPLKAVVDGDLTEGALRVAATAGASQAQKDADGQWRTTPAWVTEYKATRHRREP